MNRVRLTVSNGVFEGNVHPDSTHYRIMLSDAEFCSSGKKFARLLTFFDNEIIRIDYINETNGNDTEQSPAVTNSSHKAKSHVSNDAEAKSDKNSLADNMKLELNVVIIDEINENFHHAIEFIKRQKVIGVAVEGILVGRRGKVCWLQIRAGDFVYLFDMLHFGNKFCEKGIKEIFEDSNLLKIMHDCRLPSDAFFHKFGITLTNIFDTQVADILIRRMDKRSLPTHVRNLSVCADEYLNLSAGVIRYTKKNDEIFDEEKQMMWKERPMSREMMQIAIHNVTYLRDLRMEMMQRLLSEFEMGVDVYLGQYRDVRDEEVAVISPEVVPNDFKSLTEMCRRARSKRVLPNRTNASPLKSSIPSYFNIAEPASFKVPSNAVKKLSIERASRPSLTNGAAKSSTMKNISSDDEKPASDIAPLSSEDSLIDRGTNNHSASGSVPWATTSTESRTKNYPPAGFRPPSVRRSLIR